MITARSGLSHKLNSFEAGKEAAQNAKNQMQDAQAQLLFISASAPKYNQQEVLDGIVSVFGNIPMVGGAPLAGVCSDLDHEDDAVVVTSVKFEKTEFKTEIVENLPNREYEAGKEMGEKIKRDGKIPDLVVFFTPCLGENGYIMNMDTGFLAGFREILGDKTMMVGASTGNDDILVGKLEQAPSFQYFNGQSKKESVVAVGFWGDLDLKMGINHGWEPIGIEFEITKADGQVIQEIDGKPAIKIYEDYLGKTKEEILDPEFFSEKHDGFYYPLGLIYGKEYIIKQPIATTPDGGIVTLNPLRVGSKIRLMAVKVNLMEGSTKETAQSLSERFGEEKPELLFVISCASRKAMCIPDQKKELETIQKEIGNVPIFGIWSAGEFGMRPEEKGWYTLNQTLVLLGIKEK